jgi:OOP family OmpA-OmpF porin
MRSSFRRAFAPAIVLVVASSAVGGGGARAWAQGSSSEESTDTDEGGANREKEYRFELGLYGGYHIFADKHGLGRRTNDSTVLSPKSGLAVGGRLSLYFNPYVGLEADTWWTPTKTRGLDPAKGVTQTTDISVFGYRGSLIVNFVPNGPFRPFIRFGVGGLTSIVNNEKVVPGDQDAEVDAGLGARIFFGERAGLRIDGTVMVPPAAGSSIVKIGSESEYGGPDFQILGTLFFNFGEVERSSHRTVVRKETVMMAAPPPPTPQDPDGDGIFGTADKCPMVAEDRDGFEDDDGCPDPDNDKDGIPDAMDKCPNQPETRNGIDDEDGCPEIDSDGDGFLGSRDKCPDAPETVNGYKDDDGCPDELPVEVKKFTGVIEGINFKTASSEILPGSYGILDRAVKVLQDFPDIRMEIQGHTDNRGKADYNRELSQRRAESVRDYFIAKGLKSERLTAVGYGFDRPVADNVSEFGRSKNRRTEFRLITGQ